MFRFTIRDVLWLTIVVALVLGWLVDHSFQRARFTAVNKVGYNHYQEMLRLRQILNEKVPGWER